MSEYLDVHAMADGQVSAEQAKAVEAAMASDSRLRSEYESVQMIKSTLKTHCQGIHCQDTWTSCCDRIAEIDKADRVTGFVSRYAWQLCGSFIVLMLVTGLLSRGNGSTRSLDPSQVPTIAGFAPRASGSTDDLGFRKYLTDFQVQGAYVALVDGREVWRYNMVDGRGAFQLYVAPGVSKIEGACHRVVQGLNCYSWIHRGAQFIVVADREHSELEAIAERINSRL